MTSLQETVLINSPPQIIGIDLGYGPDRSALFLCSFDENADFQMVTLDEDGLARLSVEGIIPHAPIRPFEPNRFSKSRGRI